MFKDVDEIYEEENKCFFDEIFDNNQAEFKMI